MKTFTPCIKLPMLLPALAAFSAHAQQADPITAKNLVDNIIVTATRTPQPLSGTLAQAQVITRDEIDSAGDSTLAELLQRKAGLEIRTTGGPGQPASVLMRGSSATHTLVLVDGLRVSSSTSGAAAFENIPLEMIERIEIVKGPMSGLYGSDAIGGVIQIFTRASDKPRLTAAAGFGTESASSFNAGFSVSDGKNALTLDAGTRRVRAASATNPAASFSFDPDRDPYTNTHALVKLSHTLWQGEVVTLSAWQSRGRTDFDAGANPANAGANNRQNLTGYQLVTENKITDGWKSRLSLGKTTDDSVVKAEYGGTFRTDQDLATWFNEFKTPYGHSSVGLEWRAEKLRSDVGYDVKKRETASVFAGYLERINDTELEFSLRRDEEDQFSRRNTWSVSWGLLLRPNLTAYLRAGHAFRAPSFNDLYYPGFSNPALQPETSNQGEIGIRWRGDNARVNLVHFENRIDDLIVFDTATFLPQNLKRARIKGWEAVVEASVAGFMVKSALTAQRPLDRDTGYMLRSRARQFGNVSVSKNRGNWDYSVDVSGASHRYDSSNEAAGTRMAGYALVGAQVRYKIDKTWSVEVNAQNLTDRKYELAQGYNTAGRSLFINVRAKAF